MKSSKLEIKAVYYSLASLMIFTSVFFMKGLAGEAYSTTKIVVVGGMVLSGLIFLLSTTGEYTRRIIPILKLIFPMEEIKKGFYINSLGNLIEAKENMVRKWGTPSQSVVGRVYFCKDSKTPMSTEIGIYYGEPNNTKKHNYLATTLTFLGKNYEEKYFELRKAKITKYNEYSEEDMKTIFNNIKNKKS